MEWEEEGEPVVKHLSAHTDVKQNKIKGFCHLNLQASESGGHFRED